MKRLFDYSICFVTAFLAVYLSGYGNLMNHISESLAYTTFAGAVIVLFLLLVLFLEMYRYFNTKIQKLTKQIEKLEEEKKK
jgi:tellurite resistance protein TehA-like permease